ncbi:unnamed protein product [Chilo suppressalis]|uniref:DOMON domain-containing protein n=1 Tax=Chilo suppressalis TaxID=168631 RepID=A0ABN8B7E5_CHISP|nr:hypothetical protein evm_009350 [Chilo suppressalis]CAH0401754.1 unnamed protein product [Chilo suppressalis]
MYFKWLLLLTLAAKECSSQEEDGPYLGKYIGKLNSYHHQVSGDVYAVDEWTILLVNFNYDGTGDDTFFWAGDSGRPGPQGFIVPDQNGKTNILERYYNEDVRLTLPEGKRITRIKWLAVYDIGSQNAFGDVYIPDDFEAPSERSIGPLVGDTSVSSQSVKVVDAVTIIIPEFKYDGSGEEVYFWAGVGPQPSARGFQVPDEYGYLEPLRPYKGEDVRLELPGGKTIFDIKWLSIWDSVGKRSLASVLVRDALVVPPAVAPIHPYRTALPHCRQLHRDFQVSWEIFGNQITIELAGKLDKGEYMSFGISGSDSKSTMVGADVAVTYYSEELQRPFATDYNITAKAPCVHVLGQWQGVCRDTVFGGQDSNQVLSGSHVSGLARVTYRRELKPVETFDREWIIDKPLYVVWAIGALDHAGEPAFHRLYHKQDIMVHLGTTDHENSCFNFTIGSESVIQPWETAQLSDPALRVFNFRLGPSGGARGPSGRSRAPLAWYVNGQLRPHLQLRRGLHYSFMVWGGNNPHSATEYHPLIVTVDPEGGLERLSEAAQRQTRVLAGIHVPRRGRLAPTAAGGLCIGRHASTADRRRDDDYLTFRAFNRSLRWECSGEPALLNIAPNSSWPDLLYYNSFTHSGMGGRIYVVDKHRRMSRRPSPSFAVALHPTSFLVLLHSAFVAILTLAF